MSTPPEPRRVPTLTEVVSDIPAVSTPQPVPPPIEAELAPEAQPAAAPADEERVADLALAGLQARIDALFEQRLRETLAPRLARLQAAWVDEMRTELAVALREIVAQAVAEQAARHRKG